MVEISGGIIYSTVLGSNDVKVFPVEKVLTVEVDLSFLWPRIGISRNTDSGNTVLYIDAGDLDNMKLDSFLRKLRKAGFRVPPLKKVEAQEYSVFEREADNGKA